jgi:hypothetical protein
VLTRAEHDDRERDLEAVATSCPELCPGLCLVP